MKQTSHLMAGNFNYAVGQGPPALDARTNEPVPTIGIRLQDNEGSGEVFEAIFGADNARDLAMKILDALKQGSTVPTFGADVLNKLDGRPPQ